MRSTAPFLTAAALGLAALITHLNTAQATQAARAEKVPIRVAITVDDLPNHGALPPDSTREQLAAKMLAGLKKHRVPEAYGFINAGKVEVRHGSRKVLEMWREAGYPLGNHTYLHPDLVKITPEAFIAEIDKNEPMLKELAGNTSYKFFRYPFLREGNTLSKRNAVRAALRDRGYAIAQVTIDFEDWSWNNPYARCRAKKDESRVRWLEETYLQNAVDQLDRAETISKTLFKRSIPHVLLLHIGGFDAEMIDRLLSAYEKRGVEFITLGEALRDEVYSLDPAVVGRYGSEFTYQVMKSRGLKLADVGLKPYEGYPEAALEQACR